MATNTSTPRLVISAFLISNMHCPSCVAHIQDTLYALEPRPSSVSPSLVTSVVTVQHDISLSVQDIHDALELASFEICDVVPNIEDGHLVGVTQQKSAEDGYLDLFFNHFNRESQSPTTLDENLRKQHLENCEACRRERAGGDEPDTKSPPRSQSEAARQSEDSMLTEETPPPVTIDSTDDQTIWRASLAIGGMTCAACAGSIKEELMKKAWIRNVVVNLISNSATVDFVGSEHRDDLVESIEDIGFDAFVDNIVDEKKLHEKTSSITRSVDIKLDGMYCPHCPSRITTALKAFNNQITIDKAAKLEDPILKITYSPHLPSLTIRSIMTTISAVDPVILPSIYHPPTLEERSHQIHKREQMRLAIRVATTFVIAIPTFIIGIVYMSLVAATNYGRQFFMHPLHGVSRAQWALFALSTPVFFLCADVFHLRALKELRAMWRPGSTTPFFQRFYRFGSMNMLMSLGTSIAYISSVAQLIAYASYPPLEPDESAFYFDSVVFLTLFLLIGRLIEAYSKSKTGDAVSMLGKLRPTEALLVERGFATTTLSEDRTTTSNEELNGESDVTKVNVDLLEFGDVVRVLHGASPPCDGVVVLGETKFDESSLTGESRLMKKATGDELFSGTVNKGAPVSMKITGVAGSSMLDQIVKAVREGQTRRAPMEHIADRLTSYFVPFITYLAISIWIIWLSLGLSGKLPLSYRSKDSGWVAWSLQFAIAVFVVACPCGLALAAPTALFVGGGLAAKYGILVKGGGEAFEKASKLDAIVFDKTGTLTLGGEPKVTDFKVFAQGSDDEATFVKAKILGTVQSLEDNSSHTIAKALVSFCKTETTTRVEVENVEEVAGHGMKGTYREKDKADQSMIIGNEALLSDHDVIIPPDAQSALDQWKSEGKSVALAAIGNKTETKATPWCLVAIFAVSDPIRPESRSIIKALLDRGKDVWMLSGDNQITANAIGAQLGIHSSNIIAGVLPSQKAEKIQYLQKSLKARDLNGLEHAQNRALVAMVGDGINDSPALTVADVGIAIGSGSDIAISSAGFVLVSSNLNSLITLLDLSKFVFRRIKFNFGWALVYNMIALPVAGGALYPIVSGGSHIRLDPVWASLAMAASSISVVLSSLSLRSKIPGLGFRAKVHVGVEDGGEE